MYKSLWVAIPCLCSVSVLAQHIEENVNHPAIEEVRVVSLPIATSESDTSLPINVLSGEALREALGATLGETLNSQIGVTLESFGSGVGKPVIRGQSGNRVRVLQGGMGVSDASSVSPDHINAVEPLVAKQIEVIRGPATLLYGNGAIGGVVNVVDNRIPEALSEASLAVEQRYNSADNGRASVIVTDLSAKQFAFHFDASKKENDDVDIPEWAILEEHHEEGDVHVEEPGHEEENYYGYLPNSSGETSNVNAGVSWVGSSGFFGISIGEIDSEYGLPVGSHDAHDHGTEEPVDGAHEEEVLVRLKMEQTRYEVKSQWQFEGPITSLSGHLVFNDYQHTEEEELHVEPGAAVDHGEEEHSTLFSNEGVEGRFLLNHGQSDSWKGVLGTQFSQSEFVVTGEGGYIPVSDIDSYALFAVESFTRGQWIYELGLRAENQTVTPQEHSHCERESDTVSGSAAAIWKFNEASNVSVSLSRSQRAPTIEELYSNVNMDTCGQGGHGMGAHVATGLVEIGNADLENETSTNFELGYEKSAGSITGSFSLFHNEVDDFIYLKEHLHVHAGDQAHEEPEMAEYDQRNATFQGLEAEVMKTFDLTPSLHLDWSVYGDYIVAEFENGENLPRISPARIGTEFSLVGESWTAKLRATNVSKQDEVAEGETETEGYTRLDLYADYHVNWDIAEFTLFAKGKNLLDEDIRHHTSFIKHLAPEAGRGFELGIRLSI
ncbi:TonB-dependent receptor [Teredinibacter sp. KSP-S5-2]|uniref:TonB-dependent receptor n=1 Tax=Teredinibacter sp. KSP-S5-2 TaxID=3034506 RepID=UPI0029348418|nr:TonB-dependent receptor [Teredinibacter sp. KSP-S5-2]WNO11574.1 TonB-dependent receptor [Teredinibacter sp. KSP-S5-2]